MKKYYTDMFNKIKECFQSGNMLHLQDRVGTNSQTSYVLALMFDLLPEDLASKCSKIPC